MNPRWRALASSLVLLVAACQSGDPSARPREIRGKDFAICRAEARGGHLKWSTTTGKLDAVGVQPVSLLRSFGRASLLIGTEHFGDDVCTLTITGVTS